MKFNDVDDKERYFIQPFIEEKRLIINIKFINNDVQIKAINNKNKQVKLLKRIERELESLYLSSNFKGFEIVLKGFITISKKKKILMIYDLLLKNENELKIQSKRYSIRLENLNIRFLKTSSKYIKSIFTFKYNEKNIDYIINQYIKSNLIDGLVFHKDIPYKYDNDELIIENVCTSLKGEIVDCIVGSFIKKNVNEETNEIESTEELPCIHFLNCKINNDIVSIPLDNFLDNEKHEMFKNFNEIKGKICDIKFYNILNKNGYFIVKI